MLARHRRPHVEGKPLGVEGVLGQKVQPLCLHCLASPAIYPPNLDLQVHPHIAIGQVADSTRTQIVPTELSRSAGTTDGFFPRRVRRTRRARWSPKMPSMNCRGRKPGNVYASERRRLRGSWPSANRAKHLGALHMHKTSIILGSGQHPVAVFNPGRDAHYYAPPGQNRAGPIRALGFHLGCLTRKRSSGQGCWMRGFGRKSVTRRCSFTHVRRSF